jgi:hypothetical protein
VDDRELAKKLLQDQFTATAALIAFKRIRKVLLRFVVIGAVCVVAGCGGFAATHRESAALAPCALAETHRLLLPIEARGVRINLPDDSSGPSYDSDDWDASWPSWTGKHWRVHLVYGSGGITEFVGDARCCALDDSDTHRRVCIGDYMQYGAVADISRLSSPEKISSALITLETDGITEPDALRIISSLVTTWER